MNRSLRLLKPISTRPITSSAIGRSSFLSSGYIAQSALKLNSPPITHDPRVLGIRLYVVPSSSVRADGKSAGSAGGITDKMVDAGKAAKVAVAQSATALKEDGVGGVASKVADMGKKAKDAVVDTAAAVKERSALGNAMAEAKDVVSDLASIISGGQTPPPSAFSGGTGATTKGNVAGGTMAAMETSGHSHAGNVKEDFMAVTTGLVQSVPQHVLLFGLAGTLPYLGTAFGTVFLAREANLTGNGENSLLGLNYDTALETLHHLEAAQITYGAVILSFLGALHWGMEFVGFGGEQGYKRLIVGTAPLLFAFPTVFLSHGTALAAQWVGFTLTWFMDQRASQNGWTPPWFATYRFYLSIIVGFSIIGTLAGTSYYQEGAGKQFAGKTGTSEALSLTSTPYKELSKQKRQMGGKVGKHGEPGEKRRMIKGDTWIEDEEGLEAYGRIKTASSGEDEEEEEEDEEEEGGEAASKGDAEGDDAEKDASEGEDKGDKDEAESAPSDDNEGGSAGKSQAKKDNPNEKGAAGEKNTGLR